MAGRWRILLVDDEPLARLRLRSLLQGPDMASDAELIEAGNAGAALAVLDPACTDRVDLVLLDIGLPGTDGLKVAQAIRRLPTPPAVVFVTAHAEHALQAFDLDAVEYLTKPVRRERLQAALLRVQQRRAPMAPQVATPELVLVVGDRGRVLRVPTVDVLYLKADQKYVTLVSRHGRWLLDDSLAELELRLPDGFVRVHRNAVVALAAVRALERGGEELAGHAGSSNDAAGAASAADQIGTDIPAEHWLLRLVNGEALAVSRRQLSAVREALAARPT